MSVLPLSLFWGLDETNQVSMQPVSHIEFDIDLLGDCDVVVAELCRRAGWELQHEMIPSDQKIEINSDEKLTSRYSFTVVGKA
jgi:NAD-dependent histone deacetylase SIR2